SDYFTLAGLQFVIRALPLFAFAGIGLWFTWTRRSKLGRAARMASWGFSLLMVYALASWALVLTSMIMISEGSRAGRSPIEMQPTLITTTLLQALVYVVFLAGLVLLARAIFVDRDARLPSAEAAQA